MAHISSKKEIFQVDWIADGFSEYGKRRGFKASDYISITRIVRSELNKSNHLNTVVLTGQCHVISLYKINKLTVCSFNR